MASSVGEREQAAPSEPTELFGWKRELSQIEDLLARGAARGGSLLIRGEPGIGKSALRGEAKRQAEKLGARVLSAAGAPFEAQMPFAALQGLAPVLAEFFSGAEAAAGAR